jgi:hypothetical protein
MARIRRRRAWGLLACGLVIGLAIGGALSAGIWLGSARHPAAAIPNLHELKLQAMASHGAETFAIATGPIESDVEGLFTLDYLTGELQCFVINPRFGGLGGWFKTNIATSLTPEKGKKPSYLIATGVLNVKTGVTNNYRPAGCVCYVVDANTGEAAAYSFPWSPNAGNVGVTQATDMKLIYKWKARTLNLNTE